MKYSCNPILPYIPCYFLISPILFATVNLNYIKILFVRT